MTFRNGAATDATVTLAGSGTYTTASGDRYPAAPSRTAEPAS